MALRQRVLVYGRPDDIRVGSLVDGLVGEGVDVLVHRPKYFRPREADLTVDAVVVNGLHTEGQVIAETYRASGVPVWVLELPRLRAEPDAVALLRDDLQWLPEANGREPVVPPKVAGKKRTILVALQKPNDAAHGMDAAAVSAFARETVASIKARETKPVVVRPHPLWRNDVPTDRWGADRVSDPSAEPLADVLADAAEVVTYNSTVGWDAIAAGVPVTALGRASYGEYCGPLTAKRRADALARAAASQWTLSEFRDGTAIRAMLAHHLTR